MLLAFGPARAGTVDITALERSSVGLTQHVDVLIDPKGELGIDEITTPAVAARFAPRPQRGDAQGFSYTRDVVWLRVVVRNTSGEPVARVLHIAYALLAELDFYQIAPDGSRKITMVGYTRPREAMPHESRFIVLPFEVPAKSEHTLYLRAASPNSLNIPARIWDQDTFHVHEHGSYALQALYFGAMFGLAVYNLMLFVALRDANYLLYVVFNLSVGLAMAGFTGMGFEYLWPQWPFWQMVGINMCGSVAAIAMLYFTRRVLGTARLVPGLDRTFSIFVALNVICLVALPVAFRQVAPVFVILNMSTSVLLLITGLACALKRERSAYYFVVAFGVILVAVAFAHLRNLGILPTNVFTSDGTQIGSAIEMVLLSFALADRYNVLRRQNAEANERALQVQSELVRTLQASEHMLETRVQERTAELQALNQKLEAISATDGLTGVANRRHFDATLTNEWARARRVGHSLVVGLVDVDWFKPYNDHYGHPAGDEVLRQVAQALAACFPRTGDLVARYGGEEFVFLIPAANLNEGRLLAERARAAVAALAIVHKKSPLGFLSASIGVAVGAPSPQARPEALLDEADRALYRAKHAGRNRVELAAPFPSDQDKEPYD